MEVKREIYQKNANQYTIFNLGSSPTFSPQRDMSPSTTGCTTPPHE